MIDSQDVSVIIPVYGPPDEFEDAVESVLREKPGEIVIVDDCSPRPLPEIRSESTRILYCRQPRNRGPAAARNEGIRMSSLPWISFIDSDDLWVEGRLRLQLDLLEKENAEYIYGRLRYIRQDGGPDPHDRPPSPIPGMPLLTIKRQLMLEHLLEESLRIGEDSDLYLRLRKSGAKGLSHDDVVLLYRYRPNSLIHSRGADQRRQDMVNLVRLQTLRRRSKETSET